MYSIKEIVTNLFITEQNEQNDKFVDLCRKGNLEDIKTLIDYNKIHYYYNYSIQVASRNGHLEVVKLLIEHGADVTDQNNLAIRWASEYGHLEVVKLLLAHGATIDDEYLKNVKTNIKEYLSSINNNIGLEIKSESQVNHNIPKLPEDNSEKLKNTSISSNTNLEVAQSLIEYKDDENEEFCFI